MILGRKFIHEATILTILTGIHNCIAIVKPQTPVDMKSPEDEYLPFSNYDHCPIGFTYEPSEHYCYRLKGPETYENRFTNCAGNLYHIKSDKDDEFYKHLPKLDEYLWTEHKTMYPGGFFIDWFNPNDIVSSEVYYKEKGNLLFSYILNQEYCLIYNRNQNKTRITECNIEYYRFCVIKPYEFTEQQDGRRNADYMLMRSPVATYIQVSPYYDSQPPHLFDWNEAKSICSNGGVSLLSRGWRYINHPLVESFIWNATIPVNITVYLNAEDNLVTEYDDTRDNDLMQHWVNSQQITKYPSHGAIQKGSTNPFLVDHTFKFGQLICEQIIELVSINMTVYINENDQIALVVNSSSDEIVPAHDIRCFTDSRIFFPTEVDITSTARNEFTLQNHGTNGYYWCVIANSTHYKFSESNKTLYISDKESLTNYYTVKIRCVNPDSCLKFTLEKMGKNVAGYLLYENLMQNTLAFRSELQQKLELELALKASVREDHVNLFIETHPGLVFELVPYLSLKKFILMDVIIQVQLSPDIMPVGPGRWVDIQVEYMKPAYYCDFPTLSTPSILKDMDDKPQFLELGESWTTSCYKYTCAGNFNDGVLIELDYDCNSPQNLYDTTTDSLIPANEQLQQVMETFSELLKNDTINVADINDGFDQMNELLETKGDLEVPVNLLQQLDQLGSKITLNGSSTSSTVRNNIALVLADAKPDSPVRGLRIAATGSSELTENALEVISNVNSDYQTTNVSEAVVYLPESVANSTRRITFIIFRDDRAFQSTAGLYSVNSRVLSITAENLTSFKSGEFIDIHLSSTIKNIARNRSRVCGYWDYHANGTGFWSQAGCTFIRSNQEGVLDTCRCDHLTCFAEFSIFKPVFSERHEKNLELLTIVGCFMSIVGLLMIVVTAAVFKTWRMDFNNKVLLQLCMAILVLVMCFLLVIYFRFDSNNISCKILGVSLHYSLLASFCWMLVAAFLQYKKMVAVFKRAPTHKLLRATAFSWGFPCAIVGILVAVDTGAYLNQFVEKTPSAAFCFPSGLRLWLGVYVPVAMVVIINGTLFFFILRSMSASPVIQKHGGQNDETRNAFFSCLLCFLFGLPWVLGVFAHHIVGAYLFTLTATMQGFVLFVCFVLGMRKTRDLWLIKLKIKKPEENAWLKMLRANRNANLPLRRQNIRDTETEIEERIEEVPNRLNKLRISKKGSYPITPLASRHADTVRDRDAEVETEEREACQLISFKRRPTSVDWRPG